MGDWKTNSGFLRSSSSNTLHLQQVPKLIKCQTILQPKHINNIHSRIVTLILNAWKDNYTTALKTTMYKKKYHHLQTSKYRLTFGVWYDFESNLLTGI